MKQSGHPSVFLWEISRLKLDFRFSVPSLSIFDAGIAAGFAYTG
jgi:hypothetical protein